MATAALPFPARRVRTARPFALPLFVTVGALFVVAALLRSVDHDEGQYVAAVALMRHGLPYRDFAYLQTPLQPLLLAPLAWVCEGWLYPALRIVNALMVAVAVVLTASAARRAGASDRAALFAALALATSHMALFAATLARNDALPLLLHVAGLRLLIPVARGEGDRQTGAFFAGLLLAAAASAKISYGLPALAAGLWALACWRTLRPGTVLALAIGGLAGGLPTAWAWSLAPEAARFGILDYSLTAPFEWRTLNGQGFMLQWPLSAARLLRFLAQGCGLVALIAVGARIVSRRRRAIDATGGLLGLLIVAGLLAAWLPRPVYVQYLGPLLPALFIAMARLTRPRGRARDVLVLAMLAGVAQTAWDVASNIARLDSPLLSTVDRAHRIGGLAGPGTIVTLSPEQVIDSNLPLDPRFATGLFLFRTRTLLNATQTHRFHTLTHAFVGTGLDAAPPTAILTGAEIEPSPAAPQGLDAPLIAWADAHGYRRVPLQGYILHVRPSP